MILMMLEAEESVNITPMLTTFFWKFLVIFAVVTGIAILTPRLAKRIDEFRAAHEKPKEPEDPRMKMVRGPYDMPEPEDEKKEQETESGE
ncbi:MAG: hypothetical protein IK130_08690 [Oscillospiraceae bacterium]|nr:hypothetical protein [Oscillospiraceae bacterium]